MILKEQIKKYLYELRLVLHEKKQEVFPVKNGLDFLGYRLTQKGVRVRKSNFKKRISRYRKGEMELEKITGSIKSWIAHVSQADSYFGGRSGTTTTRTTGTTTSASGLSAPEDSTRLDPMAGVHGCRSSMRQVHKAYPCFAVLQGEYACLLRQALFIFWLLDYSWVRGR